MRILVVPSWWRVAVLCARADAILVAILVALLVYLRVNSSFGLRERCDCSVALARLVERTVCVKSWHIHFIYLLLFRFSLHRS